MALTLSAQQVAMLRILGEGAIFSRSQIMDMLEPEGKITFTHFDREMNPLIEAGLVMRTGATDPVYRIVSKGIQKLRDHRI